MSFNSLDQILAAIKKHPAWTAQEQYFHLTCCWEEVVGKTVSLHTRPLNISRQVLWVATSSSVWAQELSLQRYSLLKKLNSVLNLNEPLIDIRFSPAKWHTKSVNFQSISLQEHPSFLVSNVNLQTKSLGNTPQSAYSGWAQIIQERSQHLPLCPNCNSPTPNGELERWSVCAYCAAQNWSTSSNSHV